MSTKGLQDERKRPNDEQHIDEGVHTLLADILLLPSIPAVPFCALAVGLWLAIAESTTD